MWWPELRPMSSEQRLCCEFSQMVKEFPIRRLDEDSLFLEVRGQVTVCHGDGLKSVLDKVSQILTTYS